MQTLGPYLSRPVRTVEADTPVGRLRALLEGSPARHLVVVGPAGEVIGAVRAAAVRGWPDAATSPADAAALLSGVLILSQASRLDDALRALVDDVEDIVVAVDAEMRPVGVLTEQDGVRLAARLLDRGRTAGQLATRPVLTATPDEPARRARQRMRAHEIRHLVIVEGERPVGVLSERDLLAHPDGEEPVGAVRGPGPLWSVDPQTPAAEVAAQMAARRLGCAPVVDGGALAGILTRTDLIRALLAQGP